MGRHILSVDFHRKDIARADPFHSGPGFKLNTTPIVRPLEFIGTQRFSADPQLKFSSAGVRPPNIRNHPARRVSVPPRRWMSTRSPSTFQLWRPDWVPCQSWPTWSCLALLEPFELYAK